MPRLRCPRCSHVFPKPEGEPTCPSCGYAPRPAESAASEPDGVEAQPAAASASIVESSPTAKPSREERQAAKQARKEARQAAKAAKAAKAAEAPAGPLADAPTAEGGKSKRRFFGKKKTGKRISVFLLSGFLTLLIGGSLPYAGTFLNQGLDSELDVATAHFVFVKDASGQSFTPYLTAAGSLAGVNLDQARLGEMLLLGGLAVLFVVYVFALAKRPGLVLLVGLAAAGLVAGGSLIVEGAVASYPGDLFPIGPFAIYGGLAQVGLALLFALFRALRRPTPT